MTETWASVLRDPEYQVSTEGRVKGPKGNIKAQTIDDQGYYSVGLRHSSRARVHVLMAEAFLGPRPAGLDVMHRDGMYLHNTITNLEYGTRSQNILTSVEQRTHKETRKTKCVNGHEFTSENTRVSVRAKTGRVRRTCRQCEAKSQREYYQRKKVA